MSRAGVVVNRWDPLKGENYEYRLDDSTTFSSVQSQMFVVGIYPQNTHNSSYVSLERFARLLDDVAAHCIAGTATGLVVANPATNRFVKTIAPTLASIRRRDGSVFGSFEPVEIDRQLALRRENVTYEEWLIGGGPGKVSEPATSRDLWQLESLLRRPDEFDCLSALFGETREMLLFVRPWSGLNDLLRRLDDTEAGRLE